MSLIYNGTPIPSTADIVFNSTKLSRVIYGNTTVWNKVQPIWDIQFDIKQDIQASSRGEAACGRDSDGDGRHTLSWVYITCHSDTTISMKFLNIGFDASEYSDSDSIGEGTVRSGSMKGTLVVPDTGECALTATASTNGSGDGGVRGLGCASNASYVMPQIKCECNHNIPGCPIHVINTMNSDGYMSSTQINGEYITNLHSRVSATSKITFEFTLANLGNWKKASLPVNNKVTSCTVNGIAVTSDSPCTIDSDTITVKCEFLDTVGGNTNNLMHSGTLRLEVFILPVFLYALLAHKLSREGVNSSWR